MTDDAARGNVPLSDLLGQLLEGWANVEGVRFVSRSHGQYTTATVSRDCLLDLMRAVQAAERERCAKLCEELESRLPYGEGADCASAIRWGQGDR